MSLRVTPSQAIRDRNLLGAAFPGGTWTRWLAVIKGAFGETLTTREHGLFYEVAERDPPTNPVKELWIIAGRRAGKDSLASAVATTFAMNDCQKYLRPGETASILCLACDRMQSKIVLNYIRAFFRSNPLLSPLVARETEFGVELNNSIEIIVQTNSFRAIRGKTVLCAILDEASYWRSEESANPDTELYTALKPSMITLPDSMLIGISTPYRKSGLLYSKFAEAYGKNDPDVLVVKGATRMFNELVPESFIQQQLDNDPESGSAEWLAEFRSDISDFVPREIIEAAIVLGRHELPCQRGKHYYGFVDPSGGSSDSMALAIAHRDGDRLILDALRERRPPFSPESVVEEFVATLRSYNVSKIEGDRYSGEWVREPFRRSGIHYQPADRPKSDLYRDALPAFNSGKIELLDNRRLVQQLVGLERRVSRGGRDSIDHAPGSHDDIANVCCGALLLASAKRAIIVHPEVLARSAMPMRDLAQARYGRRRDTDGFIYDEWLR